MPSNKRQVPQAQAPAPPPDPEKMVEVEEKWAEDADGQRVEIGDTVTLTLKVTGIRCMPADPAVDRPSRDDLELALVKDHPDGGAFDLHFGCHPAKFFRKA